MHKIYKPTKKTRENNFLSDSQHLLNDSIFNSVSEGIILTDIEGSIMTCNGAALKLHGYQNLDELKGKNVFSLITPEDRKKAEVNIQRVIKKGTIKKERFICLKKNGETFIAEISASLLSDKNGKPIGFLSITSDITEIESANEQLRLLVTALESAANEVVITDNKGEVIWVNSSFNKLTGYNDNEIIGKTLRIIKSGMQNEEFYKELWNTISSGNIWTGEIINRKKNGKLFTEEMTITPLEVDDGEITNYIAIKQDITEKKKAESNLTLLAQALRSISEIVIITDTSNKILFANAVVESKTGYLTKDLLGEKIDKLFPDQLAKEIADSFSEQDQSKVWSGETNLLCLDQTEFPVIINCSGMFDKYNNLNGLVYALTDISNIKNTETKLFKSELKYRSLFENSTIGIYRADSKGNILVANKRFLQILGLSSIEEIRNTNNVREFYQVPSTRETFFNILKKEKKVYGFETKWKKTDGTIVYIREGATAFLNKLGQLDHYEGTVEDITDNVLAKKEIQKQTDILKALRYSSEVFLRDTDWSKNINSAIEEIGKAVDVSMVHVFKKDIDENDEMIFNCIMVWDNKSIRNNHQISDVLNLKKCGLLRWNEELSKNNIIKGLVNNLPTKEKLYLAAFEVKSTIIVPILLDGVFWGAIAFHQCDYNRVWSDTEIEALRAAAETFSTAIKRNNYENELIQAKREAEFADRTKSEFLAQISHEIRTPLNNITSFNTLIKDQLQDQIDDDIQECFNVIDKASNRLIRTIGLILNLSELHTGSYKVKNTNFDIYTEILEKLYLENRFAAKQRNIDFELINNAASTIIQADKYSLEQIFNNLIDNALKYTVKGKIKITLENDDNNQIIINISDTGIGISEDYLPDIFNSFSQEEGGYTRKYDGNGIGLTLVKKYCELNNIGIDVTSKKEMGTTFTLTLKSQATN